VEAVTKEVAMTQNVTFEARCPDCGLVELGTDQLWLVLADAPMQDHFSFHCPSCFTQVRTVADEDTVAVLSALVLVEELDVPDEARERHDGAPLTDDDLIELMLDLDEWDEPSSPERQELLLPPAA
jgi:predicted RNA-binding Zn-ribbon protein involved in translation (DUF1610 family)